MLTDRSNLFVRVWCMVLDLFKLDGRVALVTGATRGLGQAMALGLAQAGADIVTLSRTGDDDETRSLVEGSGRRFWSLTVDLGSASARAGLIERVLAECGRIDILVNNAGITHRYPPVDYPPRNGINCWKST